MFQIQYEFNTLNLVLFVAPFQYVIMTSQYPQVTQTPSFQNQKRLLGPQLHFELFQALIGR